MKDNLSRSFWLDEALSLEPPQLINRLEKDISADVCIVGGGYTGLWTAIQLKDSDPTANIVIIEKDLCGSGASGRNAGFLLSLWAKYLSLEKICGPEEALRVSLASDQSVKDVMTFCSENNIDCDIRHDGWLWVATNDAQRGAWDETLEAIAKHGLNPMVEWPGRLAAERIGAPGHLEAAFEKNAARIQPALLARGLRRVALERGVTIYERTSLKDLQTGTTNTIKTKNNSIKADRVVLAMNAWSSRWPQIRKSIVVVTSDMFVSNPIQDRLDSIGWRDGLTVCDGRALVHYYRTTRDGRIAYGKGGMSGTFPFGGHLGDEVEGQSRCENTLLDAMHVSFPQLADVGVSKSWRGPIDRSKSGLPLFWKLEPNSKVFYAVGFSGNGIGPCHLAGKILSSLVLEKQDEWANCPLVRPPSRDFPIEPFRIIGSQLIRHGLLAKDDADDRNRNPSILSRLAASLAPQGVAPFKAPNNKTQVDIDMQHNISQNAGLKK